MTLSWLPSRFLMPLAGLLLTLAAVFSAWQYLGRTQAEKRAKEADSRAASATAQAAVLADKLAAQNAAIAALQKKLSSKQVEVARAQKTAAAIKRDAEKEVAALKAAEVPKACPAAVDYLHDALVGGAQ